MLDVNLLKHKIKNVNIKNDSIVTYFKKSVAHTKDDFFIIAIFNTLNEHLQDKYNINLLDD